MTDGEFDYNKVVLSLHAILQTGVHFSSISDGLQARLKKGTFLRGEIFFNSFEP